MNPLALQIVVTPAKWMPLTPQQQRLLDALVVDPDIKAACEAAGVGRTTAHRWLKEPVFRDELARQRDAALTETLAIVGKPGSG